MKILLTIACLLLVAVYGRSVSRQTVSTNDVRDWFEYKANHSKSYSSPDEEHQRFKNFLTKKSEITAHNIRYQKGEVTYSKGLNKFSDMTFEEFHAKYNHFRYEPQHDKNLKNQFRSNVTFKAPASVDWRTSGLVTEVKDQGSCGSCWAFSTTGSVEGQHAKSTGKLVSLSEQQLLDCASEKYGNLGCLLGGNMVGAFQYIIDTLGIDTESSYPYDAYEEYCKFKSENIGATITSYRQLPDGDENGLIEAIATVGPISVAIQATDNLRDYKQGIFFDSTCTGKQQDLDHGVLAVGYGSESGNDFYIVKNSWSTSFGENGYFRLARKNDHCGIAQFASYPIV